MLSQQAYIVLQSYLTKKNEIQSKAFFNMHLIKVFLCKSIRKKVNIILLFENFPISMISRFQNLISLDPIREIKPVVLRIMKIFSEKLFLHYHF